jgi:hypothetical protein
LYEWKLNEELEEGLEYRLSGDGELECLLKEGEREWRRKDEGDFLS